MYVTHSHDILYVSHPFCMFAHLFSSQFRIRILILDLFPQKYPYKTQSLLRAERKKLLPYSYTWIATNLPSEYSVYGPLRPQYKFYDAIFDRICFPYKRLPLQ